MNLKQWESIHKNFNMTREIETWKLKLKRRNCSLAIQFKPRWSCKKKKTNATLECWISALEICTEYLWNKRKLFKLRFSAKSIILNSIEKQHFHLIGHQRRDWSPDLVMLLLVPRWSEQNKNESSRDWNFCHVLQQDGFLQTDECHDRGTEIFDLSNEYVGRFGTQRNLLDEMFIILQEEIKLMCQTLFIIINTIQVHPMCILKLSNLCPKVHPMQ